MKTQNKQSGSFFRKIALLFFDKAKNWVAFLFPPVSVQAEDTSPHREMDEEPDAKLPGLHTSLWLYQKHIIEVGMTVTFGGSLITAYLSWIWPFLVGLAINGMFIVILLRYRARFQWQYPIIARQCTKNAVWLVFLEVFTIIAFLYWIFGDGQVVRWL